MFAKTAKGARFKKSHHAWAELGTEAISLKTGGATCSKSEARGRFLFGGRCALHAATGVSLE
jgi:hypothetical protein